LKEKSKKFDQNCQYLDLNLVEGLSIVHTNDTTDHLRDNDHVAEVSPHRLGLLTSWCLTPLQYSITEVPNIAG
jgi:hypothetical protein